MRDNRVRQTSRFINGRYGHHHFRRNFFLELDVIFESGVHLPDQRLDFGISLNHFGCIFDIDQEKVRVGDEPRDLCASFSFNQHFDGPVG